MGLSEEQLNIFEIAYEMLDDVMELAQQDEIDNYELAEIVRCRANEIGRIADKLRSLSVDLHNELKEKQSIIDKIRDTIRGYL